MVQLDRRAFLKIGSIAPFGSLPWGDALRRQSRPGKQLSVIHLLLTGGLSHIDTFDMKPGNPKFRGVFKPIPSNVDGLEICEHLPRTAKQADKYTVIRSMTHSDYSHEGALALMRSGRGLSAIEAPSMASVVSNEFGACGNAHDQLPACVSIFPSAIDPAIDRLSSPRANEALDIASEPERLREKYGHTATGQSCLRARRLVEAGVRFVTANTSGWDHHADIFQNLAGALPQLDRAYATLLEDLDQRGLLDSTIVLLSGEFGRTPEINAYNGRDHWPNCFSLLIAGGGIAGGRVWGSSDKDAMFVRDNPVEVPDLLATLYHKLGIDHTQEYASNIGRPMRLSGGQPLKFL
jgi:hypothetical protein